MNTVNITKKLLVYMYDQNRYPEFTILNPFFIKYKVDETQVRAILTPLIAKKIIYVLPETYSDLGVANELQLKSGKYKTLKNTQIKAFINNIEGLEYVYSTFISKRTAIQWSLISALVGSIIGSLLSPLFLLLQ